MAGYPKIWTTLWTSPEFRSLSGPERGMFLQLILWCKHERDDGLVLAESYSKLGTELGVSRQTASRMAAKLDAAGYINIQVASKTQHNLDGGCDNYPSKLDKGQLLIQLPMYLESQRLTAKEASLRKRTFSPNVSKSVTKKPTSRPDQSRPEQSSKDSHVDNSKTYQPRTDQTPLESFQEYWEKNTKELRDFCNRYWLDKGGYEWVCRLKVELEKQIESLGDHYKNLVAEPDKWKAVLKRFLDDAKKKQRQEAHRDFKYKRKPDDDQDEINRKISERFKRLDKGPIIDGKSSGGDATPIAGIVDNIIAGAKK